MAGRLNNDPFLSFTIHPRSNHSPSAERVHQQPLRHHLCCHYSTHLALLTITHLCKQYNRVVGPALPAPPISTIAISSSVNPYNSHTNPSICRSVATICRWCTGLRPVRYRGAQLSVQIQHALDQRHHAVVPRDVGGVGEVDRADGDAG